MSNEISRYGGWYVHSNPNYEDFEMWNSVCEDAEPDWEYRNSQRAEREEREREARAVNRREQERREAEAKARKKKEEQELERKQSEILAKASRKAARLKQERKEREQREQRERAERQACLQEELERMEIAKVQQANNLLDVLNELLAEIRAAKDASKTVYEEEDALLGAEEDKDHPSSCENDRSADAAKVRSQLLANVFGVKKTMIEDDGSQTKNLKPSNSGLALELDHLEDLLRTMAESLSREQEEKVSSEDTTQNQPSAATWWASCVMM